MRRLLIAAAVAACLPLTLAGQDVAAQLKDYTRSLTSYDLNLSIVHLNDKTVPLLFQPPTLSSMRARAKEATSLYVQGVLTKNAELDTSNFIIEQGSNSAPAVPSSIHNFTKGKLKLKAGDHVDGVLTFSTLVDVSKSFTVKHGRDTVDFKFSGQQLKDIMPAAAAPAAP